MKPSLRLHWRQITMVILVTALSITLPIGRSLHAREIKATEILTRVDDNLSSANRVMTSKMIIHGRRGSRTVESRSWIQGDHRSLSEYLSPPREKGTKMLKLDDNLWIYTPETDRTIRISGHMLRQSVMGSDLSYEDMMEDKKLADTYDAVIAEEVLLEDRQCWVLDLMAKTSEAAYQRQRLWIDQERWIPLMQELYAKSGKLLKQLTFSDAVQINDRWFPKRMHFKDMMKDGEGTEFIIEEIDFDTAIAPERFSKAALRR